MVTENPMRLVGSAGASSWHSSEATAFTSSSNNMAAQELGLLLREHRFRASGRDMVPNRSGSAPPSMEGSFAAIGNLIGQQKSILEDHPAILNDAKENCLSEEQLCTDPAYLKYYWANVNLNPRLPPPLISRENQHLAHRIGSFVDNRRLTSFDDSSSESLSHGSLSTHKEEPEDEKSPRQASGDWTETTTGFLSRQFTSSLAGRHKSLVDLIQEDFPRTPSPVYNQSRLSSHVITEDSGNGDTLVSPAHGSSVNAAKVQVVNTATASSYTPSLGVHVIRSIVSSDPSSEARVPSSSSADMTGSLHPGPHVDAGNEDVHLGGSVLITGVAGSNIDRIESEMKGLSISNLTSAEGHINQQERQHPQKSNMQRHQRGTAPQVQGVQSQTVSQGQRAYNPMDHLSHGQMKFSSAEVQPVQTSGMTPPLYATAAAYMASGNPFYPNVQASNLFAPQYSIGGYAINATLMPPFVAGYAPHTAIPMAFENSAGPSFGARSVGVSTAESSGPGVDSLHPYKFYGQFGLAPQPPFTGPLYMHYFQHPSEDTYGAAGQYGPLASSGGIIGSQDSISPQKGPALADYAADSKSENVRSGALNIPSPRKAGVASLHPYGSPPGLGILMQYPNSPLPSPVLPGMPISGTSFPGRKNENFRFPLGSNRNVGAYSAWQGQRGTEKFDDSKPFSFLEELKSSKARRFELSEVAGRILECSSDQHGSRFIQQKLETCSAEEKVSVFKEVLPHASTLMTDVFGNYVIQKFFEHGSSEQRKELANQLTGRILSLSLQMYGCRVIQKALEVIELDQKTQLVLELDGHVMRCVRDQNGNHVIQKCIECVPTEKIGFIISAFRHEVATLSTHPYGCRVIQRVLEHCTNEQQSQWIVDEILQSACSLAQDQYGNYVTQHVLERGKPLERSQIISKLAGQIVQMSQHKFASNVIEKCLEHGSAAERELLIGEIVGQTEGNDNLLTMMKDQYANYVVQKILETCSEKQREILLSRIKVHLNALKKYTYGKHIVARVEQLCGEETETSEL